MRVLAGMADWLSTTLLWERDAKSGYKSSWYCEHCNNTLSYFYNATCNVSKGGPPGPPFRQKIKCVLLVLFFYCKSRLRIAERSVSDETRGPNQTINIYSK